MTTTAMHRTMNILVIDVFIMLCWYAFGSIYLSVFTNNFISEIFTYLVAFIVISVLASKINQQLKNPKVEKIKNPERFFYIGFGIVGAFALASVFSLSLYSKNDAMYATRQVIDVGGLVIALVLFFISWAILESS